MARKKKTEISEVKPADSGAEPIAMPQKISRPRKKAKTPAPPTTPPDTQPQAISETEAAPQTKLKVPAAKPSLSEPELRRDFPWRYFGAHADKNSTIIFPIPVDFLKALTGLADKLAQK